MKNSITNRNIASSIDFLDEELEANTQEGIEIKKRYEDIIQRQQALAPNNGGGTTQPSDIIPLNVSGTEMFARRDNLTIFRGSRLEALFSGRWENQLLRDAKGRVFLDVEPLVFRKILEYLFMLKVAGGVDASLEIPSVSPEMKPSFDQYIDYFALRPTTVSKDVIVVEEDIVVLAEDEYASTIEKKDSNNTNSTASRVEIKDLMAKTKTELAEMEKKLEEEESFIAYFTKDINVKQQQKEQHADCKKSSSVSEETDYLTALDKTPSREKVSDVSFGIINLYVNGETLAVKHSTLCFDPESKLAQDFLDETWLAEHWIITEAGKACILIELPTDPFKKMIHRLQRMSIAVNKGTSLKLLSPPLDSTTNATDIHYLQRILKYYFPAAHNDIVNSNPQLLMGSNIVEGTIDDSVIIEDANDQLTIKEWLESVNKTSTSKLLYRASRDGWKAADFHRTCNDKGATLTVVKSSEGYIFGGYSSASWTSNGGYTSCSDAFLFSLKCHAGLSAIKMDIKHISKAIYCHPRYGPTFGGGHDLHISSNSHTKLGSCLNLGESYTLPPAVTSDLYFLIGQPNFKVSEYEVYQIM